MSSSKNCKRVVRWFIIEHDPKEGFLSLAGIAKVVNNRCVTEWGKWEKEGWVKCNGNSGIKYILNNNWKEITEAEAMLEML